MRCRANMAIRNNSSNQTVVSPARSSVTPVVDVHDDLMARWLRRSGEFWGGCRIMACFGASGSKIPTLVRKAESAVSLLEGRSVVLASPTQKRPLSFWRVSNFEMPIFINMVQPPGAPVFLTHPMCRGTLCRVILFASKAICKSKATARGV